MKDETSAGGDHSQPADDVIGPMAFTRDELKAVKANFAQSLGLDAEPYGGTPSPVDLRSGMRKMALSLLVLANNAEEGVGLPPADGSRQPIPVEKRGSEAVRKLREALGKDAADIRDVAEADEGALISVATEFTSRG
jgi:hypothetical protein